MTDFDHQADAEGETNDSTDDSTRRTFMNDAAAVSAAGLGVAAISGTAAAGGNGGDGGGDFSITITEVVIGLDHNHVKIKNAGNHNFKKFSDIDVTFQNITVKDIEVLSNNKLKVEVGDIDVDVIDGCCECQQGNKSYKDCDSFSVS